MEKSLPKISKALLDVASVSEVVLYSTPKARAALKSATLDSAQLRLLERIDGFRSIEQLLAMSSDLIAVHGALGKLMAAGYVISAEPLTEEEATPAEVTAVAVEANVSFSAEDEPGELENAKRLLLQEAKNALGAGATKLRPRIEACRSIEEIYDLIVKVQEHLTTTGKADPDIFLDRLSDALAMERKKTMSGKRAPVQS